MWWRVLISSRDVGRILPVASRRSTSAPRGRSTGATARMRLLNRLEQRKAHRSPGRMPEDRALALRLRARSEWEAPAAPIQVGQIVRARDLPGERALRAVDPSPNAPLLKRLVRHPYAHEVGRAARVQWAPPRERLAQRLATLTFRAVVAEIGVLRRPGNPLAAAADRRATAPPRPFARARGEAP